MGYDVFAHKQTVYQVKNHHSSRFHRDDKQDMLRYLKVEHKELIAGFKENVECWVLNVELG